MELHLARISVSSALLLFAGLGCSGDGYELAPVAGRVTLDGKPVAQASVVFQPTSEGSVVDPGPGSVGMTDAEGNYQLKTVNGDRGAVAGRHRVQISTRRTDAGQDVSDDLPARVMAPETIPPRYNTRSELTFDVPPGGTNAADFSLRSAEPATR